ncbi:uncharacterized protein DSM5745_09803 [Aspergillus mulundensis]|uniref:F-box domain-containing protein n=1 Tax=Aspergillus mulundensis TaxID=1810919 RepID=A0A3D8QRH4_9EURO|nr:hypothetical protein DSM5745_09803 [Aspergillus mulundensis]RDW64392.1 hypothetical protein DSM5745_09803 [Aspergillus mulundensis]
MAGPSFSPEIWRLVFENLNSTQDIYNICLVCRSFKTIATPLLYRSLTVIPNPRSSPDQQDARVDEHIIERLESDEQDKTFRLRHWVQEVTFAPSLFFAPHYSGRDRGFDRSQFIQQSDHPITVLSHLPNLRRITLTIPQLQSAELIDLVTEHPRKPEIILSLHCFFEYEFAERIKRWDENDTKDETLRLLLSRVVGLDISVDPFYEERPFMLGHGPNERILTVQKLSFSCPSLRTFTLSLFGNYGGCVEIVPWFPLIDSFRLTGTEVFPPLEELALNGYNMRKNEWPYWRDGLDWSRLKALTLGPQDSFGLLGRLAGYATSLKVLRVYCYEDEAEYKDRKGLSRFLRSFGTLRTLELRGYICAIGAIAHHRNLLSLCLHEDESSRAGYRNRRRVLTVEELDLLDKQCPDLRVLEVGIRRKDELPLGILTKLATSFKNLHCLSLHFELGILDREPIMPTLSLATARSIGQMMFDLRRQCGFMNTTSSNPYPFKLTLWTGRAYRRYPQMPPRFDSWELKFTNTYEVQLPVNKKDGDNEVEVRLTKGQGLDPDIRRSETPDL